MISLVLAGAVGYVAGAFTPKVGRTIKGFFVSKTQGTISAAAAKAEADAKALVAAEIKKV